MSIIEIDAVTKEMTFIECPEEEMGSSGTQEESSVHQEESPVLKLAEGLAAATTLAQVRAAAKEVITE